MPKGPKCIGLEPGKGEFTGGLYGKLVKRWRSPRERFYWSKETFQRTMLVTAGLTSLLGNELGDDRGNHIPVALAQCGCTVSGCR